MGIIGILGMAVVAGITWPISINWTLVLSVFAICFTAMATLVGIFGKRVRKEDIQRIENNNTNNNTKTDTLRTAITAVEKEVAGLTQKTINNEKNIDEMKKDYREVVQRLDDLLKQLMEFLNS